MPGQRTMLLAGLIDWFGTAPPRAEDIVEASLLAAGSAHVKSIQETGGVILGQRLLEADGIALARYVDAPGPTPGVYEGLRWVRPATSEEMRQLPRCEVWGYRVIQIKAQRRWQEWHQAAQTDD
ncbi:hypothetical protein [Streptomyces niveus]|uniref:hypothetical protein n=1 Tax=Streptomyces niveus TaxID=193462 RepID=UPI00340413CE